MSGNDTPGHGAWKAMLEATPLRNAAARVELGTGDGVRVFVKRAKPAYWVPPISWIVPLKPERVVMLDRVGTAVWRLCDGQRTVRAVVDEFAVTYRLTFHEARTAVSEYIGMLIQRGILAIAMKDGKAG